MTIWAIADLHLSFGVQGKNMDVFGPAWSNYTQKIQAFCKKHISSEDLLLIAGDISWAKKISEVQKDLEWIDALPGTKVILKGNHDYWWSSFAKVNQILPPSIHAIQNNSFKWNDVSVGGARLWDSEEIDLNAFIDFKGEPKAKNAHQLEEDAKIFARELERLELSLQQLDAKAKYRIVMTHYPPIGVDLLPTAASKLLEKYHVDMCVFGHLHSVKKGVKLYANPGKVRYFLTSADYLEFRPLKILETSY